MLDFRPQAIAYLSAPPEGFWRWADGGEVLAWQDGTTVAFRAEVETVLAALAPRGLPQFNALVILLAACRGKLPDATAFMPPLAGTQAPSENERAVAAQLRERVKGGVLDALQSLRAVSRLPAALTGSPRGKSILAEAVFENADRVLDGAAVEKVLALLKEGAAGEELNQANYFQPANFQLRHLELLRRGLEPHTSESLSARLATGLDDIPGAAQVPLKPAAMVRRLVQDLETDPEHAGMARAVRDIMAAVYLPRPLTETDELSLGGFSDIANRGTFDRLLVSELANDDLTLAVRIALNEALYIRREPPASHPPAGFAILLDCGVRMWGVPRIFATSVALALIAREERQETVTAYRATAEGLAAIDLCTREGLMAHLAALETNCHPGAGVKALFEKLEPGSLTETVVVVHADTLADAEFQKALAAVDAPFFLASVNRTGHFELYCHPHRATPLCRATIDLVEIFWPKTSPRRRLFDAKRDPNLPVILSLHPLPFLLPVTGKVEKMVATKGGGGVCVLNEGRVMRWKWPVEGAQLLTAQLPRGRTLWMEVEPEGLVHVLRQRGGRPATLSTISPDSPEPVLHELKISVPVLWQYKEGQMLFLVTSSGVLAYDLNTGRQAGALNLPAWESHQGSRYYRMPDGRWVFFTFNGLQPVWDHVTLPRQVAPEEVVFLFDRPASEGPWGITASGRVFSNTGEYVINLGRNLKQARASDDGDRVLVDGVGGREFQMIDLKRRTCPPVSAQHAENLLNPLTAVPTRNLRVNFDAISLGAGKGALHLCSNKGKWWSMYPEREFRFVMQGDLEQGGFVRKFQPVPVPADCGYTLKVARWDNGSAAFLDSRGMLHLKSADAAVPEISLVLTDGQTPVWTSDGCFFGPPFFIGNQRRVDSAVIFDKLTAFWRAAG